MIFESNAIYTLIPKNACSTMRLTLALANGCIADSSEFSWIHANNATFSADLRALATASYTFVILRCPFRRLASVYLDKLVSEDRFAEKFMKLAQLDPQSAKLSFEEFVQNVWSGNLLQLNNHWRPQVDFLVYRDYDDYFCVEQFDEAVEKLQDTIRLSVVDARELTRHGTESLKRISGQGFSVLSRGEVREMKSRGQCPDIRMLYTRELIEVVGEMYAEDIALYVDQFGRNALMFQV